MTKLYEMTSNNISKGRTVGSMTYLHHTNSVESVFLLPDGHLVGGAEVGGGVPAERHAALVIGATQATHLTILITRLLLINGNRLHFDLKYTHK